MSGRLAIMQTEQTQWLMAWVAVIMAFGMCFSGCQKASPKPPQPRPATRTISEVPALNLDGIDLDSIDLAVADLIRSAIDDVQKQPTSAPVWGQLGRVFLAHEFNQQAARAFAMAAELDPREPRWRYYQGHCVLLTEPENAAEFFEAAVALCENDPPAVRLRLVELLTELHQLDRADMHLLEFLAKHPENGRAQLAAAQLESMRGDHQACLDRLTGFHGELNRQRRAVELISEAHRRLGNLEMAERLQSFASKYENRAWPDPYSKEVSKLKTGLKANLVAADINIGHKKYDETIILLTRTIENYPDSAWAKILLAKAYIKKQRYPPAEKLLRQAIELDSYSIEAQFRLGVVLQYMDRTKEAVRSYEQAISIKPDFTMASYNLATCRDKLGDLQGAIDALESALEIEPENFLAICLSGDIHARLGDMGMARKFLLQAIQAKPDDRWARQRLRQISPPKP